MRQLRLPKTLVDKIQSLMTWDNVSLANANQSGDYIIIILEAGDRISQVTSKYNGGDIIITTPICLSEYSFPLQGFVRDFLRYYNLSPAQIHPNRCTILFLFKKLLRILNEGSMVRVFKHCYTLISSIE